MDPEALRRFRAYQDGDDATKERMLGEIFDTIWRPRLRTTYDLGPLGPVATAVCDVYRRQPGHVLLGKDGNMGILAPPQLCPASVILEPAFDATVRQAVVDALNDPGPEDSCYWHVLAGQLQEARRLGEVELTGPLTDVDAFLHRLSDVPCGMTVAELAGHLELADYTALAISLRGAQWAQQ